ncbi:MAG: hypothetical protein LAO51_14395 [Acidobacteriia bacterium]|nr:hypothetical protein [Terriglobia bacterium]
MTAYTNPTDRPVTSIRLEDISREGAWISFVPPGESNQVSLRLRRNTTAYEAIREWFFRRFANEGPSDRKFDLNEVARLWNFGPAPNIERTDSPSLHLEGLRSVEWGHYLGLAIETWAASGQRGLYPHYVLTCLDPDSRLPFFSSLGPDPIPPENRWLYVGIDVARPLEIQFREALERCRRIQEYAFMLVDAAPPRPGRRETLRDVYIYTLRRSAMMTVPQIAKAVFEKEKQPSAQRKVKDVIRRVENALKTPGLEWTPPKPERTPFHPRRTKPTP